MELTYRGSGKVFLNELEYDCNLYLNENEGGILIDIIIKKAMESFLALPLEISFLAGELSTGYKFSLVNCKREEMCNNVSEGRSIYSYHSQFLYKGIGGKK